MLVLQDLGKWMKPLESWMCPSAALITEPPPSPETCSSVGTRLGGLLASVHCDATLLFKSQTSTGDGRLWFENPDTKDLVRNEIVGKILPALRPWIDTDTDKAEKVAKIISQDFEHSFLDTFRPSSLSSSSVPKMMFSMGDLWTGSIIVDTSPATSSSHPGMDGTEVEVGLVDWEFTSPGRIGRDITQLSTWLYLFSMSSVWSSTEPSYHRAVMDIAATLSTSSTGLGLLTPDFGAGVGEDPSVEGGAKSVVEETLGLRDAAGCLLNALLDAYARKVKEYPDYAWFVDEGYDQRRFRRERLAVIRSIWILFGRELIYDAAEAKSRFFAVDVDGDENREEEEMWQRMMIELGCWYVSRAGESSDEEFAEVVKNEGVLKRTCIILRRSSRHRSHRQLSRRPRLSTLDGPPPQ